MGKKKNYGTFNDFSGLMLNFFMLSVGTITISIAVSLGTEQIRFTNQFLDYNFTDTVRNKYKNDSTFQEYVKNARILVYFLVSMIGLYGIITTLTFGYKFWEIMKRKNHQPQKWFFKNYPEATFLLINITFSISIGILAFDLRDFPNDKYGLFDSYTNFFVYPLIHFDSVTASNFMQDFQLKAVCCGIYSPKELLFDGIVENYCEKSEFQTILFPKWRHSLMNFDSKYEPFAPSFCCNTKVNGKKKTKSKDQKLHDSCLIDPVGIGQAPADSSLDPLTQLPKIYTLGCIKKLSASFVSLLYTAFLLSTTSTLALFVSIFIKFVTPKTLSIRQNSHDLS